MGYSTDRAKLEHELAKAHRALYYAEEAAQRLGDDAMALDIAGLSTGVAFLAAESLKDKKMRKPQISGQTSF